MAARRTTTARQQPSTRRAAPAPAAVEDGDIDDMLEEEGVQIVTAGSDGPGGSLVALTKGEVMMQLDAAHKWPRRIKDFVPRAIELATYSKETAESCSFALKRFEMGREKIIRGPSIRLAEMVAATWGNLHTGARIIEIGQREVVAQAIAWDLESNLKISIEAQRSIMTSPKKGTPTRFGDSMIQTTCMAAVSIALRNAILRTIPRALVNEVYERTCDFAAGVTPKEQREKRDKCIGWLIHKRGVALDRILARFELKAADDFDGEDVKLLISIVQSIKAGEMPAEEAFPLRPTSGAGASAQPRSKASAMDDLQNGGKKKSEPPPANDAGPPPEGPPSDEQILQALGVADKEWEDLARLAEVREWSPAEKRIAFDWAIAMADTTIADEDLPPRPEFLDAESRQPGEEG